MYHYLYHVSQGSYSIYRTSTVRTHKNTSCIHEVQCGDWNCFHTPTQEIRRSPISINRIGPAKLVSQLTFNCSKRTNTKILWRGTDSPASFVIDTQFEGVEETTQTNQISAW